MNQDGDKNSDLTNNGFKETQKACPGQQQKDGDSGMAGGGNLQKDSTF